MLDRAFALWSVLDTGTAFFRVLPEYAVVAITSSAVTPRKDLHCTNKVKMNILSYLSYPIFIRLVPSLLTSALHHMANHNAHL